MLKPRKTAKCVARQPCDGVHLLKTCHPPGALVPGWFTLASTYSGHLPNVHREALLPRPGEGQGEPVNAAFAWSRQLCRPEWLRPAPSGLLQLGKAPNSNIPFEQGEACPFHLPSPCPLNTWLKQWKRGGKSGLRMFSSPDNHPPPVLVFIDALHGCPASEASSPFIRPEPLRTLPRQLPGKFTRLVFDFLDSDLMDAGTAK